GNSAFQDEPPCQVGPQYSMSVHSGTRVDRREQSGRIMSGAMKIIRAFPCWLVLFGIAFGQGPQRPRQRVQTTDGRTLEGVVLNQSSVDMQLQTNDQNIHLLRVVGDLYREVTSQVDWPTYHGLIGGNRFTTIDQINPANVSRLTPKWMFTMTGTTARAETTPVVVAGVMYVTSANECWALDAGTGREIWHFRRPRTVGLIGNATGGFNRGVA